MSAREWKPGDVALRRGLGDTQWQRTTVTSSPGCATHHTPKPHWHHADGGWDPIETGSLSTYRPLVVTDPENRKQVERLAALLLGEGYADLLDGVVLATSMQAALRSLATPPKPDEPQGRYAVVEEFDGTEWVRAELVGTAQWKCLTSEAWSDYSALNVETIHHDGVTS